METDILRYDAMVQGALRGVVREALTQVAEHGLPGNHHFFITFRTDHPDVVRRLREAHERWWDEVAEGLGEYCPISLGNDHENPTCLSALDVLGEVAWNQCHVAMAKRSTGKWEVDGERPGDYRLSLRRWPEELGLSIGEALAESEAARLAPYESTTRCGTIRPTKALVKLFGEERVFVVPAGAEGASVPLPVRPAGQTLPDAWFVGAPRRPPGAYDRYVTRLQGDRAACP